MHSMATLKLENLFYFIFIRPLLAFFGPLNKWHVVSLFYSFTGTVSQNAYFTVCQVFMCDIWKRGFAMYIISS